MKLFVIRNSCGEPYLIRLSFFEILGYSLKLHVILRSDDDRALHDHPWTFLTLMLAGGYYEHTFTKIKGVMKKTWVRPGSLRLCRAPHAHRLELAEEKPTDDRNGTASVTPTSFFQADAKPMFTPAVTLVFMWPRFREWGFYTSEGWKNWKSFLSAYPRRDC